VDAFLHTGADEGTHRLFSLNFDTTSGERVKLADAFPDQAGWQAKLIELIHHDLAERDVIAEGQTPVTEDVLDHAAWCSTDRHGLMIDFPMRALGPTSDEETVTLTWTKLREAGL
jgi:hypothetical protein